MNTQPKPTFTQHLWIILCGALAGGMGWGIRGQYGHETGAMMAGLLVSSVIAVGYLRHMPSLFVARAMALATIAIGIGGSMTYGQTVGLTHDPAMVGNWSALRWGMLGLAVKGAIWIGFSGLLLGHALSGRLLSPLKMIGCLAGMWGLYQLGLWLINQPFDPTRRLLPEFYFSADWHWRPDAGPELKPRREVWGGLGLALVLSTLALRVYNGDRLALRMAGWGMLGGGIGFPAGQCFQAYHAWNLEAIRGGSWQALDRVMNWWNVMETTYGCVMGACLLIGIALNRKLIAGYSEKDTASDSLDESYSSMHGTSPVEPTMKVSWPPLVMIVWLEGLLLALHLSLLVSSEFIAGSSVGWYSDGLIMAAIPLFAVSVGRFWPYFLLLPVTAIPIAGKTFREMVFKTPTVSMPVGIVVFLMIPIGLTVLLAWWWSRPSQQSRSAARFAPWLLLVVTWMYFGLNFAFFQFPFPWNAWTTRTPNAIFYFIAACCLTTLSLGHIGKSAAAR
ncbi:MAG: hypothetical protein IT423_07065 [Pirellulaceae bacterium]|nr:hypothetical protein [Pirellulaceae bacterium]